MDVNANEIDIVHLAGKKKSAGKPRSVLVKCVSHKTKAKVMREKKKAKNVQIKEDLAHGIQDNLYKVIKKKFALGIKSLWTVDRKIRCNF